MRTFIPLLLAASLSLSLATGAFADDSDPEPTPTDTSVPAGPALTPTDPAPMVCDTNAGRQRFLEVRGAGFDAFARQRLQGAVVDAAGAPRVSWTSVWVSPQGQLTLEIALCGTTFSQRQPLGAGAYTVLVGPSTGAPVASTTIELNAPPEAASDADSAPAEDAPPASGT